MIQRSLRPIHRRFRSGEGSSRGAAGHANGNHALLAATRLVHAFEQPLRDVMAPCTAR